MVHRGSVTGLGVLLLTLAIAAEVAAEEIYVGTVAVSAGAKPGSTPLTLTIREYTSDEWVLELAQLLHKRGTPRPWRRWRSGRWGRYGSGTGRASGRA